MLHPGAGVDNLKLVSQIEAHRSGELPGLMMTPPPAPLGRSDGGLVPCAVDDDAGAIDWATGRDPDAWSIVYRDEDGDAWRPFDIPLGAFLVRLLERELPELGFNASGHLDRPLRFVVGG